MSDTDTVKTYLDRGRVTLPIPKDFLNVTHRIGLVLQILPNHSFALETLHKYHQKHRHYKHVRLTANMKFNINNKPASRTAYMKYGKVKYL